jgi:hypothetical protein
MLRIYKFTEQQIADAGVLHIPKSARENPDEPVSTEEEFQDQLLLAMSTPITDEDNPLPMPRICYCPGDDTDHA